MAVIRMAHSLVNDNYIIVCDQYNSQVVLYVIVEKTSQIFQ